MRVMLNYLKMDMYRAFVNSKFIFTVIVIAFLPFLACAEKQGYSFVNVFSSNSIFEYFNEVTFWTQIGILIFIIISFVYADCICDDLSQGNYIYSITRGNINGYVMSKIICVFINSIVTFITGMLLFAGVSYVLFGFQWEVAGGEINNQYIYSYMTDKTFSGMLENKNYLIFFLCSVGTKSILYGITSLSSLLMSLYIKNKLLIMCVPVLLITVGSYSLEYILPNYNGYKYVYSVDFFNMKDTSEAIIMLGLITIVIVGIITMLIIRRMRRIVVG